MARPSRRAFVGWFVGVAILAAAVLAGVFAATGSAGSASVTFDLSVLPKAISAGEDSLVTTRFENAGPGTVNHVVITMEITGAAAAHAGPGCNVESTAGSTTVIACPVGQVKGGTPAVVRQARFTAPSSGDVHVKATATWDEAGPGGGNKAVKSSLTRAKTATVLDPDPDLRGGCAAVAGDPFAAGAGGTKNLTTSFSPLSTPGLCAPVTIVHQGMAGKTCGGNACTTNGSYATFAGEARVTINFYFPPPGGVPTTFPVYWFANEADATGELVESCLVEPLTRPCYESVTRIANERRIEVVVKMTDTLVDPGIAG